jgi:hypothetical protein
MVVNEQTLMNKRGDDSRQSIKEKLWLRRKNQINLG